VVTPGAVPWNSAGVIRVAAAGDIHAGGPGDERFAAVFADAARDADVILLAGDLTLHGEPDEAAALVEAVQELETPIFAVLGNHDWHGNRCDELVGALGEGGIRVLDKESAVVEVGETSVGVAGVKGFIGGFPDASLPDFGEPSLRRVYAETTEEVEGLGRALEEISECDVRIALLHYAPTSATVEGEPPGIFAFLGSDRLAVPIAQHHPDIVLHGHAHRGTLSGMIGDVPVYNVAQPVIEKDFEVFELGLASQTSQT
jgi:Icc-related predicted phosphoesterase